jgi:glycopeptide antibiotics resistance protein
MVIATHIVFKWLAKHNHILTISWIYVFTLLLVITFSIEIGQGITKTGTMDFGDIVYGLGGFILFFAVYALIRGIIKGIAKLIKEEKTGRE